MRIRSIEPLSCGKMLGGVYAFIALLFGAIFSLISLLGIGLAPREGSILAIVLGVGAVVIFPIVYFIIGLIGGILFALFYNVVAKVLGGVQFEVESLSMPERM